MIPRSTQIHVVQELLLHVPIGHRARVLQQTVSQGRLAVVDGNDAKLRIRETGASVMQLRNPVSGPCFVPIRSGAPRQRREAAPYPRKGTAAGEGRRQPRERVFTYNGARSTPSGLQQDIQGI